jgi:hypothetical protein
MEDWDKKPEVKKGVIGENIVINILESKGYVIYKPITKSAHKIDFFIHKADAIKQISAAEVKTKRRLIIAPSTGIDNRVYKHYKELFEKHCIDTYLYFVDDFEECIYAQWLAKLDSISLGYQLEDGQVVWDLKNMDFQRELKPCELLAIREYNASNIDEEYKDVTKYFKMKFKF